MNRDEMHKVICQKMIDACPSRSPAFIEAARETIRYAMEESFYRREKLLRLLRSVTGHKGVFR
jgi:hypothetical protein